MMQRHEAMGTLDHPQYQAAITLLNYRHVCRLDEWPQTTPAAIAAAGRVQNGSAPGSSVSLDDAQGSTTGQHDELTPACAMRMKMAARHAELHVFPNSSHMPFYEEPQAYFPAR